MVVRTRPKKKLWRKNFVPAVQLATPRDFTTGSPPALVSCYARANQVPRSSSSRSAKTEAIHADCPGLEQVAPQSVARCQGHVPPLVPSTQLWPHPPPPLESPFVRPSSPPPKKGTQRVARRSGHQKAWHSRSTAGISRLGCNHLVLRSVTATRAGVKLGSPASPIAQNNSIIAPCCLFKGSTGRVTRS